MNAPHPLNPSHEEALLTPNHVSMRLGVTPETLQAWRTHGRYDLPYIKVGRLIRYRPDDVSRFIVDRMKSHTRAAFQHSGARP